MTTYIVNLANKNNTTIEQVVFEATSEDDAIEQARQTYPDLIQVDIFEA